jgi:predicted transcriptional regulator
MPENRVDLKRLILLIKENKDFEANLILDEGCVIETSDPKPLVKVMNYFINYLNQISAQPLEIALDLRNNDNLLSFMVYTDVQALPEVSSEIDEVLKSYRASLEKIHEKGKYVQFKISFAH